MNFPKSSEEQAGGPGKDPSRKLEYRIKLQWKCIEKRYTCFRRDVRTNNLPPSYSSAASVQPGRRPSEQNIPCDLLTECLTLRGTESFDGHEILAMIQAGTPEASKPLVLAIGLSSLRHSNRHSKEHWNQHCSRLSNALPIARDGQADTQASDNCSPRCAACSHVLHSQTPSGWEQRFMQSTPPFWCLRTIS